MLWQNGGSSTPQIDQHDTEEDGAEEHWSTVSIFRLADDGDILDLAWSPDGQWLLAGTSENCAVLFDASTGTAVSSLKQTPSVLGVGKAVRTFKDHCHYVQGVAWDPLDQHIGTASADRTVKLWRIVEKASRRSTASKRSYTSMHKLSRLDGQPMFHDESLVTFFRRLCFTPDGMHLMLPAAFDGNGKSGVMLMKRSDLETPFACLPGFDKPPLAIRCNPRLFRPRPREPSDDSSEMPGYRIVFAVASRSAILIYDTQDFMPLCSYTGLHYGTMTDLAWSADGRTLVMASQDGFCSITEFEKDELGEAMTEEEQEGLMQEIKREHCSVALKAQQSNLMDATVLSSDPIILEVENLGESNLPTIIPIEDATTKTVPMRLINDLSKSIKRRIAQTLLDSISAQQASEHSNATPPQ